MTERKSLWRRIDEARRRGRLPAAASSHVRRALQVLLSARYLVHNPAGSIVLHCPEYVAPDRVDRALTERILRAFKKMKADQRQQSRCYQPSAMWQAFLDDAYTGLAAGFKHDDLDAFHFFLANFGTWKQDTAVESITFIRDAMGSVLGRRYLQNRVFLHQLKIWTWFYNGRKPLACLTYPRHGNQAGAFIEGLFVGMGSFFNEIYGSLLAELLRGLDRPVVAELGAGYGKLSYFTMREVKDSAYIDFDLPETLCLASYYLMKTYPDKKALLYGEADYAPHAHGRYDLIFMPSWEIEKVGHETVDLFINKNSLGEMTKEARMQLRAPYREGGAIFFPHEPRHHPGVFQRPGARLARV